MGSSMDMEDQWLLLSLESRVNLLGFEVISMDRLEIFMQQEILRTEGRNQVQLLLVFQVEECTKFM